MCRNCTVLVFCEITEKMDPGVLVRYENQYGPAGNICSLQSPTHNKSITNGKTTNSPGINITDKPTSPAHKRTPLKCRDDDTASWMERIPTKADIFCGVSSIPGKI